MLDTYLAWFDGAGPEVQAALIGNAGITAAALLTVVGTALFAIRQYRLERKERARDQALEIKKEILFESVRGGSRALAAFAALTDLEKTVAAISSEFQLCLSSITVASAVGDINTVQKGRDLLNAIGPRFIQRAVARKELDVMHARIEHTQANMDSQLAENQTILGMQRDAIASNDKPRAEQTNALFQAAKNVFDMLDQERDKAIAAIDPPHQQFIRETMAEHSAVIPAFHAYIAAIRKDIGIDVGGPEEFLQATYIDPARPAKVLNDALDKLSRRPRF